MAGATSAQWPSAVLWDIDGTLVNSTDLAWSSTNLVLKQNGFGEVSEEEYRKATRLTTPKRLAFHATKDVDAEIGLKMAEEFDNHYVQLVSPTTVPVFPGLQALLEELAEEGVVLGALSNACGAYVRAVLRAHGFAEAFRTQLGADDVAEAKPAPGGLVKCCEILALRPNRRVCYVGDSAGDGKAARAAGKTCPRTCRCAPRYGLALSNDQALDESKSSTVTVGAFMVFMRRYGLQQAHSTSKQKLQSNQLSTMSEEEEWKQMLVEAPALDANRLMSIATDLTLGIHSWLNRPGAEKSASTQLWPKFIEAANETARHGRLRFGDFKKFIGKAGVVHPGLLSECVRLTASRIVGIVQVLEDVLPGDDGKHCDCEVIPGTSFHQMLNPMWLEDHEAEDIGAQLVASCDLWKEDAESHWGQQQWIATEAFCEDWQGEDAGDRKIAVSTMRKLMEARVDARFTEVYQKYFGTEGSEGWTKRAFLNYFAGPPAGKHAKMTEELIRSVHIFSQELIIVVNFGMTRSDKLTPERFPRLILLHGRPMDVDLHRSFNFNKLRAFLFSRAMTGVGLDSDQFVAPGVDRLFEMTEREINESRAGFAALASPGYTGDANMMGSRIAVPSFEELLAFWREATLRGRKRGG
eukprot:Skav216488  [mRNA]  locus=scaffold1123:473583:483954:- [translate_table: standard]